MLFWGHTRGVVGLGMTKKYLKSLFINNYLIVFQQEVTFSIPASGTHYGISLFIYRIDLILKVKTSSENTVFLFVCFYYSPEFY